MYVAQGAAREVKRYLPVYARMIQRQSRRRQRRQAKLELQAALVGPSKKPQTLSEAHQKRQAELLKAYEIKMAWAQREFQNELQEYYDEMDEYYATLY